jgi:hypothetical protein
MPYIRACLFFLTVLLLAGDGLAYENQPVQPVPVPGDGSVRTAKERLGDKASDEQRVDNCKVPPERRGPTPRPGCASTSPTRPGDK